MSPPGAQAMQNGDAAANGSTGIEAYTDSFVDRIFGTRTYTPGAALQKPRKVPLRIEPKTWFGELRMRPSGGPFVRAPNTTSF